MEANRNFTLSVILPTFKRPEVLARTLQHLGDQDVNACQLEVIVCEDGCTDATRTVVDRARTQFAFPITLLQHEGHCGPGLTQNEGIRAARAEINLLLADDIWLSRGALKAHLAAHEKHPEPHVTILGKVLQSPELMGSVFLRHWDPFHFSRLRGVHELPYYYFWGCNISFKRSFLIQHGLFREHLGRAADGRGGGGAAHEDVELGYRLRDHGLRIVYDEEAWGYHYHVYTLEQAVERYYERGLNFGEFRRFVPDPEILVQNHVLTLSTLREYASVFRRLNFLKGAERSLPWQIARRIAFMLVFNKVTVSMLWSPLLAKAEDHPFIPRLITSELYRAYLYYHFMRGIADAKQRFQEAYT